MRRFAVSMSLIAAVVLTIAFAVLSFRYWDRVFGRESALGYVPFWRWLVLGLIMPAGIWLLVNFGLFGGTPLVPVIAIAQAGGHSWLGLYARGVAGGLLVIASYWTAMSFSKMAVVLACHAESRRELAIVATFLAVLASPLVALCLWHGGLAWTGAALLFWLVPVTHCTVDDAVKPKAGPSYARAVAQMKLGKYEAAEKEVIHQLERREDDIEGWLILAELYASQFGDLAEAERTIQAMCDQPNVNHLQISLALHHLADWYLKFGDNPAGARRALSEIVRRLPQTHFARMAQLRLQQLPATRDEWIRRKQPRSIRMPALKGDLQESDASAKPSLSRSDALRLVDQCVEQLKRDPNDIPAREKLARLFTEDLGKPELGIEQLELLLGIGNIPGTKPAEWLSLLAAWQYRYRQDRPAARRLLEQIIREYPQSVQGFAAQRWLNLLEMEERSLSTKPS
jgi:hypothetical protein